MRIFVKIERVRDVASPSKILVPSKTIVLDVKASDSIDSVKAQIQRREDIAKDVQILSLGNNELHNNRTLSSYQVLRRRMSQ